MDKEEIFYNQLNRISECLESFRGEIVEIGNRLTKIETIVKSGKEAKSTFINSVILISCAILGSSWFYDHFHKLF